MRYAWLPEDDSLLLAANHDRTTSLSVLSLDGKERAIADLDGQTYEIHPSPGGHVAVLVAASSKMNIDIIDIASGSVTEVVGDLELGEPIVGWLHGDELLVIEDNAELVAYSTSGDRRSIYNFETFPSSNALVLSPDKSTLAWSSLDIDATKEGIYLTDVNSGVTRFLAQTRWITGIEWSADGATLAYTSSLVPEKATVGAGLFVIPASGGSSTQVTDPVDSIEERVHWREDGQGFVVWRSVELGCTRNCEPLHLILVSPEGKAREIEPGQRHLAVGKKVAVFARAGSVDFVSLDDGGVATIYEGYPNERYSRGSFSPDGEYVAFVGIDCTAVFREQGDADPCA